jgi:hypothetical protein
VTGTDQYEPDNNAGNASTIFAGNTQTHSLIPATDHDYVRFSLSTTSDVVIETGGASGDTRMWLYSSNVSQVEFNDDGGAGLFSKIDRLNSGGDPLQAGTYYVMVNEYGLNHEIPSYTISLTVSPLGGGSDDAYEQNDTLVTSFYPGFNWERTNLSDISGAGVQADSDWYEISVTPGYQRILADLSFLHSEGDIDMNLYDSSGNFLSGGSSVSDNESITYDSPSSGVHYLQVYYGDAGNSYDLWWDDVERGATSNIRPVAFYVKPRSRSNLRSKRHWGYTWDWDGVISRVRKTWPRDPWRKASYSGVSDRFSYRVRKQNKDYERRRWVRFKVKAYDDNGAVGKDSVVLRNR